MPASVWLSGACRRTVLAFVGVADSTFYYDPKAGTRGRTATTTTLDANDTVWTEEQLVALIAAELEKEFVDYGYIEITKLLQCEHDEEAMDQRVGTESYASANAP